MTLVKKMSVCFVLLCCSLIGGSFATPIPTSTLSSNPFSEFLRNGSMLFVFFESYELPFLAYGSHFFVPFGREDVGLEQECKSVAIAFYELSRNLKTMLRTVKLIDDFTEMQMSAKAIEHNMKDSESLKKYIRILFRSYIEAVDNKLGTDEELGAEYKKQKSIAQQFVKRDPKISEPLLRVGDNYTSLPTFVEYVYNIREEWIKPALNVYCNDSGHIIFRMYAKKSKPPSDAEYPERYLMARALVQKAQSSNYESKVNDVYHKALAQIQPYNCTLEDVTNYEVTEAVLFSSIEKVLASEPTLQKEIKALMKQFKS